MDAYSTHLPVLENLFKEQKIDTVFEFGTGLFSTPLFCKNSKAVTCIEMQDEQWFLKVKENLKDYQNLSIFCMLGPSKAIEFFDSINENFDLVFVDGHGDSRPECINSAFKKARIVVSHDMEEPGYRWERISKPDNFNFTMYKTITPWTGVWIRD